MKRQNFDEPGQLLMTRNARVRMTLAAENQKNQKNQKFIDLFVCFSARRISKKSLTCADMHQVELGRIAVRDLNEVDT
jgi:hypothetical protein